MSLAWVIWPSLDQRLKPQIGRRVASDHQALHFLASSLALKRFSLKRVPCSEAEFCCPPGNVNVRYGSLADITARSRHIRFTPNHGRWAAH
jgi:hypothetical protein